MNPGHDFRRVAEGSCPVRNGNRSPLSMKQRAGRPLRRIGDTTRCLPWRSDGPQSKVEGRHAWNSCRHRMRYPPENFQIFEKKMDVPLSLACGWPCLVAPKGPGSSVPSSPDPCSTNIPPIKYHRSQLRSLQTQAAHETSQAPIQDDGQPTP
jgi:hypothetical protein